MGWDWAGIQLDDGSELMVSVVWNTADGTPVITYGTYVPASPTGIASTRDATASGAAASIHLTGDQIQWASTGAWTSPVTGVKYPQGWNVAVDSLGLSLQLAPSSRNAEFTQTDYVPVTYWEGAVDITGYASGEEVGGKGFVELVGYDENPPGNIGRDQ